MCEDRNVPGCLQRPGLGFRLGSRFGLRVGLRARRHGYSGRGAGAVQAGLELAGLGQDTPGHASQPDHNPDNSSATRVATRGQFWHFGSTSGNSGVLIWLGAQGNTALRRAWAKIHKVTHRNLMTSRTAIRQFGRQFVGNSRQLGSISGNSGVLKWLKTQEIRQFGAPAVSLLKI